MIQRGRQKHSFIISSYECFSYTSTNNNKTKLNNKKKKILILFTSREATQKSIEKKKTIQKDFFISFSQAS